MTAQRRLSICYAAPGQNLLASAGPTRNVLSVAEALSEWADVTVAFRHVLEPPTSTAYRVIAIEPATTPAGDPKDDTATRGFHPLRHLAYCRTLQLFAQRTATEFDVVLEKGWRLSGLMSTAFLRAGVPSVLVENAVSVWMTPVSDVRGLGKFMLHRAALAVTNTCSRRVPVIIAETEELAAMLVRHRGIAPGRIEVVQLGVDHRRFCPMNQQAARDRLGIAADILMLLYVGGLDEYHDLEPVIDALGAVRPRSVELHVVGDGAFRARVEKRAAAAGANTRFYGHVPHDLVPYYIASADLCLAPYRTSAFHGGVVTFATLKIPEYMACARPVVSVDSPAISRFIADGVNGFLLPNAVEPWLSFMRDMPSRTQLAVLGRAAADAVSGVSWKATARRYFGVCEGLWSRDHR